MRWLAFACALALAPPAFAAECPADAGVVAGAHLDGPRETSGVVVETLVAYDLAEHYDIADRTLRVRRLIVAPGGVIGRHDHSDRPGAAVIVEGEMVEYRDTCAVGITHRAGEAAAEQGPLTHWWRNESDAPAVIIVTDLFAE